MDTNDRSTRALSVNEFVRAARFPEDWNEETLQDYLIERMRSKGWKVEKEYVIGDGSTRADIVVLNDRGEVQQVIEVKPLFLSRDKLYQAKGQAELYSKQLNALKPPAIMGFYPDSERIRVKLASCIKTIRESGVYVTFPNCSPNWLPLTEQHQEQVTSSDKAICPENADRLPVRNSNDDLLVFKQATRIALTVVLKFTSKTARILGKGAFRVLRRVAYVAYLLLGRRFSRLNLTLKRLVVVMLILLAVTLGMEIGASLRRTLDRSLNQIQRNGSPKPSSLRYNTIKDSNRD